MIIGLIVIGVIAVLLLFGLLKPVTAGLRLSPIALFVILALFAGLAFVPPLVIGYTSWGVAGWILPLVLSVFFVARTINAGDFGMSLLAFVLVAAVCVPCMLFAFGINTGITITVSVLLGIVVGGIAFFVPTSYNGAVFSILFGYTLGQAITALVDWLVNGSVFAVGGGAAYGSLMIGLLVAVGAGSLFTALRSKTNESRIGKRQYNSEYSDEFPSEESEFDDYFSQK